MPMSDYYLPGTINGIDLTILLNKGAAITLLRQNVWTRLAAHQ